MMKDFFTVLPRDLLLRHNFFELYPFDGGGYFIQQAMAGSLDDRIIAHNILHGNILDDFGVLPELDFTKFENWQNIEKSCWLNRMYMLPSLARVAALENDQKLSRLIINTILHFQHYYPGPKGQREVCELGHRILEARDRDYNEGGANLKGPIEYQWFDFQPASRIVNVMNAVALLNDTPPLEVIQFIHDNAEVIYLDEKFRSELKRGNHQALRGLALLYAAVFFDHHEWMEKACEILNFHFENDYFHDGLLREISPSYHIFETWIMRDAFLLAKKNGIEITPEAEIVLNKAFQVCRALTQPDGSTIVLDDGYSLSLDAFRESFPTKQENTSFFLKDAKIAIHSDARCFAVLDGSPSSGKYSHYHAGKNAVTLWFDDIPFVVDSNCCNYDENEFSEWYKQSFAHSSLLINGQGDGILTGRSCWSHWAETEMESAFDMTLSSPVPEWRGVTWRRKLEFADHVAIMDEVEAGELKKLEFIYILHPGVRVEIQSGRIILHHQISIEVSTESSLPVSWSLLPGRVFLHGCQRPSLRLMASVEAKHVKITTFWRKK